MDYNIKLKRVKDLYLDLGVAISELQKAQATRPSKVAHVTDRVMNVYKNRKGQIINIYQMHEILSDVGKATINQAMSRLAKEGKLKKLGLGTYVYGKLDNPQQKAEG